MNRELAYSFSFKLFLSVILALGMTGCGIKFGADARQAAENTNKNKKPAVFVEVDNTKPEPKVVPAKKAAKPVVKKTKPAKAAQYVRVGKNRRLKYVHSSEQPTEMADKNALSPVAQVKKAHKTIKNTVRAAHEKIMTKLGRRNNTKQKVLYPTVQLYGSGIRKSEWLVSSKDIECYIAQPIPRLGKVKFSYNPVKQLEFVFEVDHPPAKNLKLNDKRYAQTLMTDKYPYPQVGAKLESIPPDWKPFAIKKMLGYIPFKEGYQPFILPHRKRLLATQQSSETIRNGQKSKFQVASLTTTNYLPEIWPDRLMEELEEGMSIRLTYRDWIDGTQDVITTISPITFAKKKLDFEKCVAKLPKYSFNKFKRTQLNFTKGQKKLSKKMRAKLYNMVKFIKLDETIKKVVIKSYTDSTGFKRLNKIDAKIQAKAIKRYMQKLGMSVPITAIGIGEGPYVASNRSSAGRAKNRRSLITLIK